MPHTIMKPSPATEGSEMSNSATAESTNDPLAREVICVRRGGGKATWKREFKPPWREAGPPNHHDDKVDSDQ